MTANVPDLARLSTRELVSWAKRRLDDAAGFEQVRAVKATAAAVEAYQRASGASADAILACKDIKVRAARKLGVELKKARQRGEIAGKGGGAPGVTGKPKSEAPTLADLGVGRDEAATAVALAGEGEDPDEPAPEELFEAALAEAKEAGQVTESAVAALMVVGAKAVDALPEDASPAQVSRARKKAMREAMGIVGPPPPREADRLARATKKPVWGSDSRWHTGGPPPTPEQEAEAAGLVRFRQAVEALIAPGRLPPDRVAVLTAGWDREFWRDSIPPAIEHLRQVLVAFEAAVVAAAPEYSDVA